MDCRIYYNILTPFLSYLLQAEEEEWRKYERNDPGFAFIAGVISRGIEEEELRNSFQLGLSTDLEFIQRAS